MDRWFSRGARIMSPDEKNGTTRSPEVEMQIVTMRWAMSHGRFARAHADLLSTWSKGLRKARSAAAIGKKVRAWQQRHPVGILPERFGDLCAKTNIIDMTCQANYNLVSSGLPIGGINDFYAGLGSAQISLAVSGLVNRLTPNLLVLLVDEVGTYVRDTYDFNEDQLPGCWSSNGFVGPGLFVPTIPVISEGAKYPPWQQLACSNRRVTDFPDTSLFSVERLFP